MEFGIGVFVGGVVGGLAVGKREVVQKFAKTKVGELKTALAKVYGDVLAKVKSKL